MEQARLAALARQPAPKMGIWFRGTKLTVSPKRYPDPKPVSLKRYARYEPAMTATGQPLRRWVALQAFSEIMLGERGGFGLDGGGRPSLHGLRIADLAFYAMTRERGGN
jgi:hypothetical protein